MPRVPRSNWTVKTTAKVNKNQRDKIQKVIDRERDLYNAALEDLEEADQTGTRSGSDDLILALTQIRRTYYPEYARENRRLSIATLKRAVEAWDRHAHPKEGKTPAGKPRQKTEERFRTIALESPVHPIIRSSGKANRPYLCIKGLPNLRLKTHRDLPAGQQPSKVTITLKRNKVTVNLTYHQPAYPKPIPIEEIENPRGVDLGVAVTAMLSNGIAYNSPNEKKLHEKIKKVQQDLTGNIAAAIRLGLAGSKALLDEDNNQIISEKGNPRRQIVWNGPETAAYLKNRKRLEKLYQKRSDLRNDFRHRVTTEIIKQAVRDLVDLIVTEDLKIRNMTASASGTVEDPGRNVRAKSGLNGRILDQSWGDFQTKLEYKAEEAGIRYVEVVPWGTSQICNVCGERDPKSRVTRDLYICTSCGQECDADVNGAINIGDRGQYYLQKQFGKTLENIREARLAREITPGSGKKTGAPTPARRANLPNTKTESSEPRAPGETRRVA